MKIEMLETVKHAGDTYPAEDQRTVDDEIGRYFCDNGWARDMSGEYPTAERDISGQRVVHPDNALSGHNASEVK